MYIGIKNEEGKIEGRFFREVEEVGEYHECSFDTPVIVRNGFYAKPNSFRRDRSYQLVPAKMTKGNVQAFIRGQMFERGAGRGRTTVVEIHRDGELVSNWKTITKSKHLIQNGDNVYIEFYATKGNYYLFNLSFQVVNDVQFIKDYTTAKLHTSYKDYDPQRNMLYAFERKHLPRGNRLDYSEIESLYAQISKDFGFDNVPELEISKRLKKWSWCSGSGLIKLAEGWGQDMKTVLHEMAHWLLRDKPVSGHGGEFVSTAFNLYEMYWDQSAGDLKELAIRSGLEVQEIEW